MAMGVAWLSAMACGGDGGVILLVGYLTLIAQHRLLDDGLRDRNRLSRCSRALPSIYIVSWPAIRYRTEGSEKRYLRRPSSMYLHPEYRSLVVDPRGSSRGRARHLSVLFADIVRFTERSEKPEPAELVAMLNYLHVGDDRGDSAQRRRGRQADGRRHHGVLGTAVETGQSGARLDRVRAHDARGTQGAGGPRRTLRGNPDRDRHRDRRCDRGQPRR